MPGSNGTALALRLARRELRGGVSKFLIFLACLALGVGTVTALGTLSESVRQGLHDDARVILGGDVELRRMHIPLDAAEQDFITSRARITHVTRLRTMARTTTGASTLTELKAVEPNYPLYGAVTLESGPNATPMALHDALAQRDGTPGAVAEATLLSRLQLAVGDTVRLGRVTVRINGVIAREPDRAANFFGLGPRLLISQQTLRDTGLVMPGSVVSHLYKLRLNPGLSPDELRLALDQHFPRAGLRFRDFATSNTSVARGMERMTSYLALVGLAALLIGGIGAAGAVRGYLAGKLGSIAAMKCLGASRSTIVATYLLQITALALAGSIAGITGGLAVAWASADVLGNVLEMNVRMALLPGPILTALACGMATALTFSLRPLFAAAAVTPARLFRGYADPQPGRPGFVALAGTIVGAVALSALSVAVAGSMQIGLGFIGCALAATAIFRGFAWAATVTARRVSRTADIHNPRLRHALAGIHRPGAPTTSIVFSLGLGLTALTAVVLVQGNIRHRIEDQLPQAAPSFFFLNIQPHEIEGFSQAIKAFPGVTRFEEQPSMRARIVNIGATPASNATVAPEVSWAVRSARGITFLRDQPPNSSITAGSWWPPDYSGPPAICLADNIARGFGVTVGDTLTLNVQGRQVTATIKCLRDVDWSSLALNHSIIFAPGTIDNAPHTHIATAYIHSGDTAATRTTEADLARMVAERFPQAVVVEMRDVLDDITSIMDKISAAVAATAAATLLAALLVLAEALRANLATRHRDAVIFKVLGATRRDTLATLALEFLLIGAATALTATILGTAAAWLFTTQVLRGATWALLPWHALGTTLGGTLTAVILGLTRLRHTLRQPAWPVLRNE